MPNDPDGSKKASTTRIRRNDRAHRSALGGIAGASYSRDDEGNIPSAALRSRRYCGQFRVAPRPMLTVGLDIGSTTVKAAVAGGMHVHWQDYQRHNTKQAETVLEFLRRMEVDCGLTPGRDRIFV